jgi:hypothetical protein
MSVGSYVHQHWDVTAATVARELDQDLGCPHAVVLVSTMYVLPADLAHHDKAIAAEHWEIFDARWALIDAARQVAKRRLCCLTGDAVYGPTPVSEATP